MSAGHTWVQREEEVEEDDDDDDDEGAHQAGPGERRTGAFCPLTSLGFLFRNSNVSRFFISMAHQRRFPLQAAFHDAHQPSLRSSSETSLGSGRSLYSNKREVTK